MTHKASLQFTATLIIITMLVMIIRVVVPTAFAVAPENILTYQGRVLDTNGTPVTDADLPMKFFLYDTAAGGVCVWSNSSSTCDGDTPASTINKSVPLTTGLFTQNLGDTGDAFAAIPDAVFADDASVYLEVIINGETLSPRKLMSAVPYALNAQSLDGIDSTGFLASTGDTATGIYDYTGATVSGASPFVFEGGSVDASETTFTFTDPTADRTVTFQNASGTVAYLADITGGLFTSGTFGTYENDAAVIVGADAVFLSADGLVGDLKVDDELEVEGNTYLAGTFDINGLFNVDTSGNITDVSSITSDGTFSITNATNANVLGITSSATSANIIDVDGSSLTTGSALQLVTGDLTDDLGYSFVINSEESTATADVLRIITDVAGNETEALRVEGDGKIVSAGSITATDFSCTNCLDFSEFADSMNLDSATTFFGTAGETLSLTRFATTGSSEDGVLIDFLTGTANGSDTYSALNVTATNLGDHTGVSNFVNGISIATLTPDVDATETGLLINDGWDAEIRFAGTSAIVQLPSSASDPTLLFTAGGTTPLFRIGAGANNHIAYTDSDTSFSFDSSVDATDIDITTASSEQLFINPSAAFTVLSGVEATGIGSQISLTSGNGSAAGDAGGLISMTAGDGGPGDGVALSGDGGSISLLAGSAGLSGAFGPGNGGSVSVTAGDGDLTTASSDGGDVTITSGQGSVMFDSTGGDIILDTEVGAPAGGDGDIVLITGSQTAPASDNGYIYLLAQQWGQINIADGTTDSMYVHIGGVDSNSSSYVSIATEGTSGDTLDFGNANTATSFTLSGGDDWSIGSNGSAVLGIGSLNVSGAGSLSVNGALDFGDAEEFVATDDTPSVASGALFLGSATAVTIQAFDDDVQGQIWVMEMLGVTTFNCDNSGATAPTLQCGSSDIVTGAGDSMVWGSDGTNALLLSWMKESAVQTGADLAEWYPATDDVQAGDVVSASFTEPVHVSKSTSAYQKGLTGIVATQPGLVLGERGTSTYAAQVALAGRVPVKFSNENGEVTTGDYLTSSGTRPGYAMKATTIGPAIGMAMEDSSGLSLITAFVNNSFYIPTSLNEDGTSNVSTENVIVSQTGTASAGQPTFDSFGLSLRGSAWNGSEATAVSMMMLNQVSDVDHYRLSIRNTSDTEVAYISNEGDLHTSGDVVIGGNLYPSDRGTAQTSKYIYYDGSEGAGGDFMRTNASGWGTGSYDFAEMFPSSEQLKAGEVVVFADNGEKVRRSTIGDETAFAGIVSTRPGFLAGNNIAGHYPIALAGRVPTYVSIENGAIKVGDPLSASSMSGYAMKAIEAGPIIGYALETFNGDVDDQILVFVNTGYWGGETVSPAPGTENNASGFAQGMNVEYATLNMSGNIYLSGNEILGVGRIAGLGDNWEILADGTISTKGLLTTEISTLTGETVKTIATTSPEATITLTGTTTLEGDQVEVRFEDIAPTFNDVIGPESPVRVIVTPSGPVSLYVSEKDNNHFIVKRFGGDSVPVEFDWMVSAYRTGFEPVKIEEVSPVVPEEPAPQVSPEQNFIDPLVADDGDVQVENPSEPVIEQPSLSQESAPQS